MVVLMLSATFSVRASMAAPSEVHGDTFARAIQKMK